MELTAMLQRLLKTTVWGFAVLFLTYSSPCRSAGAEAAAAIRHQVMVLVSGLSNTTQLQNAHCQFVAQELRSLGLPAVHILSDSLKSDGSASTADSINPWDAERGLALMGGLATNATTAIVDTLINDPGQGNFLVTLSAFERFGRHYARLLRPALGSGDGEKTTRALQCLERCGTNAIALEDELIPLIHSTNTQFSWGATRVVARTGIHSPALETAVMSLLDHEAPTRDYDALKCVENWKVISEGTRRSVRALEQSGDPQVRKLARAILARLDNDCDVGLPVLLVGFHDFPAARPGTLQYEFSLGCLKRKANTAVPELTRVVLQHGKGTNDQGLSRFDCMAALAGLGSFATKILPELAHEITRQPLGKASLDAAILFAKLGSNQFGLLHDGFSAKDDLSKEERSEALVLILQVIEFSHETRNTWVLKDEMLEGVNSDGDYFKKASLRAIEASKIHTPEIEKAVCSLLGNDDQELVMNALACVENWDSLSPENLEKLRTASFSRAGVLSMMAEVNLARLSTNSNRGN